MPFFLVLLAVAAGLFNPPASVTCPESGFYPGWDQSGNVQRFVPETLFNHINGGAELFNEFGFRELTLQRYARKDTEIALEVYEMDRPESALGVYLMKSGRETKQTGIPARHSGGLYQLMIVHSRYYIQIHNFSGDSAAVQVMKELAVRLIHSIPVDPGVDLLERLPRENRVPGSQWIFRGPYGLQPVFTLGDGDILSQKGEYYGVTGDYEKEGELYTRIVVFYPNESTAYSAFQYLSDNLDPFLTVLESGPDFMVFQDYESLYGRVHTKNSTLDIVVRLKEKTDPPIGR